jgi:uncharacterized membrane protein YeaQ/YmgE (transglycosylase-associated protein family)
MHAMQPFMQTILNFEGFEMVAFWLGLFIGLMASGFFLDMIMQRQGFGPLLNAILALAGIFLGLYLRYNYFMRAPFFSFEPYLTAGLCFGSIAALLVSLAYMRNVFWR